MSDSVEEIKVEKELFEDIARKAIALDLLMDLMQFGDVDQLSATQIVGMIYDEVVDARIELEIAKRIKDGQLERK